MTPREFLASLFGRSPDDKGTKKLERAVNGFDRDRAVVANLQLARVHYAFQAESSSVMLGGLNPATTGPARAAVNRCRMLSALCETLCLDIQARSHYTAFCEKYHYDPIADAGNAVRAWDKAGRPLGCPCPQCGGDMIQMPGESEDADAGLGAVDPGPVCRECVYDGRTVHPPRSRGSDKPFVG